MKISGRALILRITKAIARLSGKDVEKYNSNKNPFFTYGKMMEIQAQQSAFDSSDPCKTF